MAKHTRTEVNAMSYEELATIILPMQDKTDASTKMKTLKS